MTVVTSEISLQAFEKYIIAAYRRYFEEAKTSPKLTRAKVRQWQNESTQGVQIVLYWSVTTKYNQVCRIDYKNFEDLLINLFPLPDNLKDVKQCYCDRALFKITYA